MIRQTRVNCVICNHPKIGEINKLLVDPNNTYRGVARQFGLSKDSVVRHVNKGHLSHSLMKAVAINEVANGNSLLAQVASLKERADKILNSAEESQDLRTACSALREVRGILELLLKATGEIEEKTQINIFNGPAYIEMRTKLLIALEPYPEARHAAAMALRESDL